MIEVTPADLSKADHREALVRLIDVYAREPVGGGVGLGEEVKQRLPDALRERNDCVVLLAWQSAIPVGLAVCFEGFSTFRCRPLLNIHDLVVLPGHRGRGVGKRLIEATERIARERDCCKLTLEVLEGNEAAISVYEACGFVNYQLEPRLGNALFMEKDLATTS